MSSCLSVLPALTYASGLTGLAEAGLEPGCQNAESFLRQMQERGLGAQALSFLARMLRPQEQIWWCCRCLAAVGEDTPEVRSAIQHALSWLRDEVRPPFPSKSAVTEENMRSGAIWLEQALAAAANPPGMQERQTMCRLGIPDLATAATAGCTAMAAFFSNGSLLDATAARERMQRFIQFARVILSGNDHW